jgi:hypothetical protein
MVFYYFLIVLKPSVKVLIVDSDILCSGMLINPLEAYTVIMALFSLGLPLSVRYVSGRGVTCTSYGGCGGGASSRESTNTGSSSFLVTRTFMQKNLNFAFVRQCKTISGPQKGIFLKSSCAVPVGFLSWCLKIRCPDTIKSICRN